VPAARQGAGFADAPAPGRDGRGTAPTGGGGHLGQAVGSRPGRRRGGDEPGDE